MGPSTNGVRFMRRKRRVHRDDSAFASQQLELCHNSRKNFFRYYKRMAWIFVKYAICRFIYHADEQDPTQQVIQWPRTLNGYRTDAATVLKKTQHMGSRRSPDRSRDAQKKCRRGGPASTSARLPQHSNR